MTPEEVKASLGRYRALLLEKEQLAEELERLEAAMNAPRVKAMTGMPRASAGVDQMLQAVSSHITMSERYGSMILALAEEIEKLEALIADLEPMERLVIRYHYLDGLAWAEVSEKIGYELRQTHRIKDRAIKTIAEKG